MTTPTPAVHWAPRAQTTNIHVRIASQADWPMLQSLLRENHKEDSFMRHTPNDYAIHHAELETMYGLLRNANNGNNALLLVAHINDRPAGYLLAECIGTHRQPHVVSFHMYSSKNFRGVGVGSALLRDFEMWCEHHARITKIELAVMAENVAARALYEKAGFAIEGVLRSTAIKDGKLHDLVLMGKILKKNVVFGVQQTNEVNHA